MTKIDKPEAEDRIAVPDDEKKRVIDFWDTNLPVPLPGIFDEPTRCYRINTEWAKVVMGFTSWLTEIAAWKDAQDESFPAIQEIIKFLRGDSCVNFMLRQNPEDPCLFEQSLDGGETWSLAYDYSLCAQIGYQAALTVATNQQNISNANETLLEALDNFNENYAGDIADLYPDLAYGGDLDGYREEALCYALRHFINSVCVNSLEAFEQMAEASDELKLAIAASIAFVAIATIVTGGLGLVAAGLLGASGAAIGLTDEFYAAFWNYINGADIAAFSDEMAKEEVLCHVFEQLSGSQVEQAELAAAFASFSGSANGQIIAEGCQLFAEQTAGYVAFILAYRDGLQIAQLGLVDECACIGSYSYLEYDFAVSSWGFTVEGGTHVPGVGFVGTTYLTGGGNSQTNLQIRKSFSGGALPMELGAGYVIDTYGDCGQGDQTVVYYLDSVQVMAAGIGGVGIGDNQHRTFANGTIPGPGRLADEFHMRLIATRCDGMDTIARIKKIRIWLDNDGDLTGIPSDIAPVTLPENGSTDLMWWQ